MGFSFFFYGLGGTLRPCDFRLRTGETLKLHQKSLKTPMVRGGTNKWSLLDLSRGPPHQVFWKPSWPLGICVHTSMYSSTVRVYMPENRDTFSLPSFIAWSARCVSLFSESLGLFRRLFSKRKETKLNNLKTPFSPNFLWEMKSHRAHEYDAAKICIPIF